MDRRRTTRHETVVEPADLARTTLRFGLTKRSGRTISDARTVYALLVVVTDGAAESAV